MILCHNELGFKRVRFHALLSEEMETLICEENKLLYSFFNADHIMDFLLSIGMRPFVELSFVPVTLAAPWLRSATPSECRGNGITQRIKKPDARNAGVQAGRRQHR
jgi:hypothetical protein